MKFYVDKDEKVVYGVENNELKIVFSYINGLWEETTSFSSTKELLYRNAAKLNKLTKFNVLSNAKKSIFA